MRRSLNKLATAKERYRGKDREEKGEGKTEALYIPKRERKNKA